MKNSNIVIPNSARDTLGAVINLGATGDNLNGALARGASIVAAEVAMDTLWNLSMFQFLKLETMFEKTMARLTRLYSRDCSMVAASSREAGIVRRMWKSCGEERLCRVG